MSEKIAAIEKYLRGEDSLKVTDDILNTIERLEYFPDSGSLIPLFYRSVNAYFGHIRTLFSKTSGQ